MEKIESSRPYVEVYSEVDDGEGHQQVPDIIRCVVGLKTEMATSWLTIREALLSYI